MLEITKDELLNAFAADDYEELQKDSRILSLDLENKTVKLLRYDRGLRGESGKIQYGNEEDQFVFEYKISPSFVLLNDASAFGYDYAVLSCRDGVWILDIEGSGDGATTFRTEDIVFKEFINKINGKITEFKGIKIFQDGLKVFNKFKKEHKLNCKETCINNVHIMTCEYNSYDETHSIALLNNKIALTF